METVRAQTLKKLKKYSSKQLQTKIEQGRLMGLSLTLAKEILRQRNISGYEEKVVDNTNKQESPTSGVIDPTPRINGRRVPIANVIEHKKKVIEEYLKQHPNTPITKISELFDIDWEHAKNIINQLK